MNRRIQIICAILVLVGCIFFLSCKLISARPCGLMNPFFAMDNGTGEGSPESRAKMLKNLGYAGIGWHLNDEIPQMLKELDKNGLKMFNIYLGIHIDLEKQKYDPKLKEVVGLLQGRDTMLWLTVNSARYKPSSPDGDTDAVRVIREIADMAHESGLKVALYPHFGSWLERVDHAVRLAKKVNRRNVGVTFNLCHWLKVEGGKNMEQVLTSAMPYLFVVSINGADSDGKGWDRLIQTLDRGSFDNYKLLKKLKELGFTGPIGLQGYGIGGDVYENLKRSIEAWQKLSTRIAAEQD